MTQFPPLTAYEPGEMGQRSQAASRIAFQVTMEFELERLRGERAEYLTGKVDYLRVVSEDDGDSAA